MSGVRVLVGTAKGAFILSSDGKREKWNVEGPLFAGWTIYHMKGSPIDPNRIYASQCSDWFGQSSSDRTMAVGLGNNRAESQYLSSPLNRRRLATSLSMKAMLARTCGTTALHTHGNSKESGTLNHRSPSLTSFMRVQRTQPSFDPPMALVHGKNCLVCEHSAVPNGSQVPEDWDCTQFCSTRPIRTESMLPYRRLVLSH